MGRPVSVMGLDAENGKHILVVACLQPVEGYASKDGKHIGRVEGGKFVPEKGASVPEDEQARIVRAWFALRSALDALHGADSCPS